MGEYSMPVFTDSNYAMPNSNSIVRGDSFVQLHDMYPNFSALLFIQDFEKEYNIDNILNFMKQDHYVIPFFAVGIYVLFVFWLGPLYMKNREGFTLDRSLAAWNLALSLFSFWGVSRTVPFLLYRISTESFEDTVCKSGHLYASGTTGLATALFILSKIPELIDTVFLVLKKKEVIFLHWYHHITVLLFCWNSYVTESACGLYFVAMNYTVHALMYFYFFLMAIKSVPKWFNPMILTVFQISQMFVGVIVVCAAIYYHYYSTKTYEYSLGPKRCSNAPSNMVAGVIMYSSYLYLFVEFAFKRFVFKTDAKAAFDRYVAHFMAKIVTPFSSMASLDTLVQDQKGSVAKAGSKKDN